MDKKMGGGGGILVHNTLLSLKECPYIERR
jgi:hypothetical protein